MTQIKIVYGGASFSPAGPFTSPEEVSQVLDLLVKHDVTTFDTARLYPGSEVAIGQQAIRTVFTIDTKIEGGFNPGTSAKAVLIAGAIDSLDRAKIAQFDVFYLHAPDRGIPLLETLEGVDEVYRKGIFKRFGLSNFTAKEVVEVYDLAKEKGFVLPSVYQGNYSPIARHLEAFIFPTLRKLNFAFYAYAPLAGGYLTKTPADLDAGAGRFSETSMGGLYKRAFDKPSMRAALAEWHAVAEMEGISKAELAYRWVGYNSALKAELGDAVIFGASNIKQVEQTIEGLKKGTLSAEAQRRIEGIWQSVQDDAPVDLFGGEKA